MGDELDIAVATVFRRGFQAEGISLGVGAWVLETDTGETITSSAVVTEPGLDGVVSVVFPDPGDARPSRLRQIERWERNGVEASAVVPVEGAVGERTDLTAVDLGGGVTSDVARLELAERSGILEWTLTGSKLGGDVLVFVRARDDGRDLAGYSPSDSQFLREPSRPMTAGTMRLVRDQGQPGEPAEATELLIEVGATLFTAFPADLTFDLSDLPVAHG